MGIRFRGDGSDSFLDRFLEAGEMFFEFVRVCGLFRELSYGILDFKPNFCEDIYGCFYGGYARVLLLLAECLLVLLGKVA